MIEVIKLYARSFDLDHLDVFWELKDFDGNINQFDFYLERSESTSGPWDRLAGPFKDKYYFRDTTAPTHHKWRTIYYRLRIVDVTSDEEAIYGPTAQIAEPDLIALEVTRQEDVLFREFVGRACWIFPVRTFGARCVCYDRVSGKRTKSNCLNCYDTGFLGGYLSPIKTFVQFDPNGKGNAATVNGERQDSSTTARLISFPPVKPKDIVVEAENVRWKVVSQNAPQRLRSQLHQELVLKEVSKDDVVYKLPINESDLRELKIVAERNFTNPQHPDADEDLHDLLAVYGFQPRGSAR
jgi:hypothetical protein